MEEILFDRFGRVYDITVYLDVTLTCNFTCYQCAGNAVVLTGRHAPEKIKLKALRRFLNESGKIFKFVFTGGEPLCVENLIEVFYELSQKHYLALNSNLVSQNIKTIANCFDPARFEYINASAHILKKK